MFNKDKPGEFNPKHRIVGAIILVSAAVVILPMILSDREPAGGDRPTSAPGRATKTVVAAIPPVVIPPPATSVASNPIVPAAGAKQAPLAATPPVALPPSPSVAPSSKPAAMVGPPSAAPAEVAKIPEKPASVKAAKPEQQAKPTGWYVQVGTFSQAENARHLADKLKKKGYSVQLESATVSKAKVVRVRVGPYEKSAEAKNAVSDISKAVSVNGVVGHY